MLNIYNIIQDIFYAKALFNVVERTFSINIEFMLIKGRLKRIEFLERINEYKLKNSVGVFDSSFH